MGAAHRLGGKWRTGSALVGYNTHIRSQYAAHNAVCIFRLVVDPSFDCYLSVDDKPVEVRKEVCRLGRLRQKFDKGAKLMMKRRWWEAGERAVIKSTSSFEIWYSQPEREVPTLDIPSLMWMPHAQNV